MVRHNFILNLYLDIYIYIYIEITTFCLCRCRCLGRPTCSSCPPADYLSAHNH